MNKKNILPQLGQPVIRLTAGQLSSQLAELSEEALGDAGVGASVTVCVCAYDGVDASVTACFCAYDGVDASVTACFCAYDAE
uniref:BisE n=1 Tax=Prochloron sp. LV5 TaxID=1826845 RepID=A0A166XY92_9PROC|nr:BisE [Prochloron sp. LV5]